MSFNNGLANGQPQTTAFVLGWSPIKSFEYPASNGWFNTRPLIDHPEKHGGKMYASGSTRFQPHNATFGAMINSVGQQVDKQLKQFVVITHNNQAAVGLI
jgi:hypothetical protein